MNFCHPIFADEEDAIETPLCGTQGKEANLERRLRAGWLARSPRYYYSLSFAFSYARIRHPGQAVAVRTTYYCTFYSTQAFHRRRQSGQVRTLFGIVCCQVGEAIWPHQHSDLPTFCLRLPAFLFHAHFVRRGRRALSSAEGEEEGKGGSNSGME